MKKRIAEKDKENEALKEKVADQDDDYNVIWIANRQMELGLELANEYMKSAGLKVKMTQEPDGAWAMVGLDDEVEPQGAAMETGDENAEKEGGSWDNSDAETVVARRG